MERRDRERYRVWFPMQVVKESGEEATAITYDVSVGGLLMASPGRLEIDARVELRFRVAETDAAAVVVHGRVVRLEPRQEGDDGPWRHRMAVQFDEPRPDLERSLRTEVEEGQP
jgi:c-di-GMP-binding flagellar brake protein YcgR